MNTTVSELHEEAIAKALAPFRRSGLRGGIEMDDLVQEAAIALCEEAPETIGSAVLVAKHAIFDFIRRQTVRNRGLAEISAVDAKSGASTDPFSFMPVAAAESIAGKPRTLEARHLDWEAERADSWASIRGGSELRAVA